MVDSTPPCDGSDKRDARRPSWLMLNSGVVLFVCAFLPAMDSCNEPIYPIVFIQHPASWPLLLPYALGLGAAVVAIKKLFFAASPARLAHITTIVIALGCYWAASVVYALGMIDSPAIASIPMVLCCVLIRPSLRVFNLRAPLQWRCARAIWIAGATCTIYFGLFVVMELTYDGDTSEDSLRIGMYLSLASALTLAISARMFELQLEAPPPPEPPPIPPARARQRGPD